MRFDTIFWESGLTYLKLIDTGRIQIRSVSRAIHSLPGLSVSDGVQTIKRRTYRCLSYLQGFDWMTVPHTVSAICKEVGAAQCSITIDRLTV